MRGRGEHTPDGSPVELYLRLPHSGEADIIHAALPTDASILELGAGVGRVTHPLLALGHRVVAVDLSQAMLDHIGGAETIFADIAQLRLDRKFDGVILGSTLINTADVHLRRSFLQTCAHHLKREGRLLIECHAQTLLSRAQPGLLQDANGIRVSWLHVARDGDVVSGTLEYTIGEDAWTQTFSAQYLNEAQLRDEMAAVGLAFGRWLNERRSWFSASLFS